MGYAISTVAEKGSGPDEKEGVVKGGDHGREAGERFRGGKHSVGRVPAA